MDSNLLKTKSIEQLVGDVEHGAKALKRTLDRAGSDAARHRRDHRDGHLRPHRNCGSEPGRTGHRALLRHRGPRVRIRRALLRRVRGDDSDLRQRLHLRLRHARRDLRVDDRLGPDPRIRRRVDDRRGRLERILPAHPRRVRHRAAGVDERGAGRGAGRAHQPAGGAHRARDHGAAGRRGARERAVQRRDGRGQARRRAVLHRRRRAPTSSRRTGRRSCPTASRA